MVSKWADWGFQAGLISWWTSLRLGSHGQCCGTPSICHSWLVTWPGPGLPCPGVFIGELRRSNQSLVTSLAMKLRGCQQAGLSCPRPDSLWVLLLSVSLRIGMGMGYKVITPTHETKPSISFAVPVLQKIPGTGLGLSNLTVLGRMWTEGGDSTARVAQTCHPSHKWEIQGERELTSLCVTWYLPSTSVSLKLIQVLTG